MMRLQMIFLRANVMFVGAKQRKQQIKKPSIFNFIRYHRIKLDDFILWYRIKSIPLQKKKNNDSRII